MLIRVFVIIIASVAFASAQTLDPNNTYLVFDTLPAAQARSQQQCAVIKCDGVNTVYWWGVIGPLKAGTIGGLTVKDGSYAIEVQPSGFFAKTVTVNKITGTMTAPEQSALVTGTQLGPLVK